MFLDIHVSLTNNTTEKAKALYKQTYVSSLASFLNDVAITVFHIWLDTY